MNFRQNEDYQDFKKCLAFVKEVEGGYVNNPKDKGGETKFGISKKSYPDLDIKNLTWEEAEEIYYWDFWYALCCDELEFPDNLLVLDSSIHHGQPRVIKWVKLLSNWKDLLNLRREFFKRIIQRDPTQKIFEQGWKNRIDKLEKLYNENLLE